MIRTTVTVIPVIIDFVLTIKMMFPVLGTETWSLILLLQQLMSVTFTYVTKSVNLCILYVTLAMGYICFFSLQQWDIFAFVTLVGYICCQSQFNSMCSLSVHECKSRQQQNIILQVSFIYTYALYICLQAYPKGCFLFVTVIYIHFRNNLLDIFQSEKLGLQRLKLYNVCTSYIDNLHYVQCHVHTLNTTLMFPVEALNILCARPLKSFSVNT